MKLTVKQENFCNYYIESGNASEAYRRAYSCSKMKDEVINVKASELLNNGKISVRVSQLQAELQKRSDITKDEAVQELTNIVRVRISDIMQAKGNTIKIKDIDYLPDEIKACIKSIKKTRNGLSIGLYDKIAAIDRLSRMHGWEEPFQVDTNVKHVRFEDWTDEELTAYITNTEYLINKELNNNESKE